MSNLDILATTQNPTSNPPASTDTTPANPPASTTTPPPTSPTGTDTSAAPKTKPKRNSTANKRLTKKTRNVRLTLAARKAIDVAVTNAEGPPSLGAAIIEALRAAHPWLKEQAPTKPDAKDPWADETNQQLQLTAPDGERLVDASPRLSPGQNQALDDLAEQLGWSPSRVIDAAIRHHHKI